MAARELLGVGQLEFRVLGPTEIYANNGQLLTLTKPRQCSMLCILLLNCEARLTRNHLIEALWGSDPPGDPGGALRSYIYNLRKVSGIGDRLRTHPSGYGIQLLEHDVLDVNLFYDFTRKAAESSRNYDHVRTARLLERAIAVWRTPPLADLPATPAMQPLVARLLERRHVAEEELVDAWMAAGGHHELLPALKAFTAAEPLRERRWQQLMMALYRSDRQAEALDAYARARAALKECGLDPGPSLRQLQKRVLCNDPTLGLRTASVAGSSSSGHDYVSAEASLTPITTPRQLPNPVHSFIGRHQELAALAELAHDARLSRYSATLAVISGSPGVGKSALAVHSAHQIAENFPDGQLYLDLKGFCDQECPVQPADALRGVLDSLGVPAERIPASLEARAAMYRSLLRHRRILLVADDAFDTAQVHHLVPASPGCMMIVTCRRQLTSLVAARGAQLLNLGVMSGEEAAALLASRLKRDRARAEAEVIADLTDLCARLPLALAIIAAHAAERPGLSLSHLAAEMRQPHNRLDALYSLEPEGDVRNAFAASYANLTATAARTLRIMSLCQGPEVTASAIAELADISAGQAGGALRELRQMHLVTECSPGRFSFHDLMRAYSLERLEAEGAD
jgi:DNA-binding SARP family transcriptional activator